MPRSTRGPDGVRHGRGSAIATAETISRSPHSPLVVVLVCLWRWRWELALLAAFAIVYCRLVTGDRWRFEPVAALLIMMGPAPIVLAVRQLREFVRNRIWCVITRHRVRACLTEIRTLNWSGNLPFIVGCFSTKTGELVWLWMRPGLSVEDLETKAEALASACWARQAIIERTDQNAALIRIEIVRRAPHRRRPLQPSRSRHHAHDIARRTDEVAH